MKTGRIMSSHPAPWPATPDELGRWRTDRLGRFRWMDDRLRRLLVLPVVPIASLTWADLVLPGTDLGFLDWPDFDVDVDVGLNGSIQRWRVQGKRMPELGETAGLVRRAVGQV